jgi:hypothetical protein
MSIDVSEPMVINTFGFNVPSREFVISAQITRDKRMPLVDEFILRALNIVESVNVAKFSRFFGFEGPDLGIALADLQGRSLVKLTGDEVALHPAAKELFRTAANKSTPTLASVEDFHARVWFDLVSQGMVEFKGMHNARNLLNLKAARVNLDFGPDFAREAFDANFRDYLRRFRKIRTADQWNLYSILDVQPARFSNAQLAGREILTLHPRPRLENVLLSEESERTPRVRRLMEAMAAELSLLSVPTSSSATREEYGRLVGSDALKRCTQADGFLNLAEWVEDQEKASHATCQPLVGNFYPLGNRRSFLTMLGQLGSLSAHGTFDVIWLRPGGSAWGVSEDIGDFLADLRATLKQSAKPATDVNFTLMSPASVAVKFARSFERLFDRGLQLPASSVPAGLEVLVIPGVAVMVSAVVPLSSDVDVPIGLMTTDPLLVARIEERASSRLLPKRGERPVRPS